VFYLSIPKLKIENSFFGRKRRQDMKKRWKKILTVFLFVILAVSCICGVSVDADTLTNSSNVWKVPYRGQLNVSSYGFSGHMQGFAVDTQHSYMYWSYTQTLIKTDLQGFKVKKVSILEGHLGDIAYSDGYIYGTVMLNSTSGIWDQWTGFYIYKFDSDLNIVEKIELPEIQRWADIFWGVNSNQKDNPHDICGIDGIAIGKDPQGNEKIMIAAGIGRVDNLKPYQVLLQYSMDGRYETQYPMETGALPFGCQAMTYDWNLDLYWLACYGGEYPGQGTEYRFFAVDIKKPQKQRVVQKWNFGSSYGIEYLGERVFYAAGGDGNANLYIMTENNGMKPLQEGSIVTRFTTTTKTHAVTTVKTSTRQDKVTTKTSAGGAIKTSRDNGAIIQTTQRKQTVKTNNNVNMIQTTQGNETVGTDDSAHTIQTEDSSQIIQENTISTKKKTKKTTDDEMVDEIIENQSEPFPWWTFGVLAGLAAVIAGVYILVAKKINN
jgi:hypothetical protein